MLARHGWSAQLGDTGGEPEWRCPSCNERLAASGVWDLEGVEPAALRRRVRLLLVDDQVLVLRATAGMLRELDVVTAGSATEALDRLAEGSHFDVIVSDVSMPQMSGPELYVRVRERHPQLAERFLLLSGDSYGASLLCSAIARRENLPSMPKILDKPVPRDVLVREVDIVSQRRMPRSGTFSLEGGDTAAALPRAKTK